MSQEKKESFILYLEHEELINELSDEDAGRLFKQLFSYVSNGQTPDLSGSSKLAFISIRQDLDRNRKKYEEIIEKRKIAGSNGGKKRVKNLLERNEANQASATFAKINSSKSSYNDNVNVNVNDNDNDNENENENVSFSYEKEIAFKKEKKEDIFFNPLKSFFIDEYEKVFTKKPYLSQFDLVRLKELSAEYENFKDIIPEALERLKKVKFDPKINFTPSASWLFKGNNFDRIMNGEFEPQKSKMELLKEELGIED